MKKEIEAKFFITDKDALRAALAGAGLACVTPERRMRRCNFQFAQDFSARKAAAA